MTAATGPFDPAEAAPRRRGLRVDRVLVAVAVGLAAVGALLGLVWSAWAPPAGFAYILSPGVYLPGEGESFIAGDGRFLVLGAALGVASGVGLWFDVRRRGPGMVAALVVGTLGGSYLTELVGHLTGGGSTTGPKVAGTTARQTSQLPLSLHAQGLLFVAPFLAVLLYGILAAFTTHDDLGRPDPRRARRRDVDPAEPS